MFFKIGWVTTDNAANNGTMMVAFERLLRARQPNTEFSAVSCHIRWVSNYLTIFFWLTALRCFAHIVNLTCQEMLRAAAKSGADQVSRLNQVINYVSPFVKIWFVGLYFKRFAPHQWGGIISPNFPSLWILRRLHYSSSVMWRLDGHPPTWWSKGLLT